ncbi:hypothetical protein [Micrococcus terreus]|uniref:hypothetical protein n=1 Tax=Micrococcus terreus TaxID=574650 RepID=UPI0029532BD7|nr:hypothetical protein [Micrococcus terreus]MDK7701087.1 hypothetical protein [Micrococcus terreus]WOO96845.1 hypothetical protein R3I42_09915 [Micrococcus terreus]
MFGRPRGDEVRLDFARDAGMVVGDPESGAPARDEGFDTWVEASGAEAGLHLALQLTKAQAVVVVPALFCRQPSVDMNLLVRKGIQLRGTYGYRREHFADAYHLVAGYAEQLTQMVTRFPLSDAGHALSATAESEVIKAIVLPNEEAGLATGVDPSDALPLLDRAGRE